MTNADHPVESSPRKRSRFWRKVLAVPVEHGMWTWWIGPLLIGAAAGGHFTWRLLALAFAACGAFFLHQPITIAVKALTGRRGRADLAPALGWVAVYALFALSGVYCLLTGGYAKILWLAVPGVVVFGWYLALVGRRSERRQMGVEILGAGTLALTAPAAYWVAGGTDYPEPWVLWALTWLQSASAIANVYLRLEQRVWANVPPLGGRVRAGRTTLVVHAAALAVAVVLAALGQAPPLVPAAFVVTLADAIDATWHPMLRARPSRIGIRQLLVWVLFVALMVVAYLI